LLKNAVPSYNELFDHLEDWEEYIDTRLSASTSVERGQWLAAISIFKNVLSKNYSKTDSRLYACVTYCDPLMREWYWMEAGYEDEWIARAREQVQEVYDTRYALHSRAISRIVNIVAGSEDSVQRAMKKQACIASDELSLYLQGGPALSNFEPLIWWSMHSAEFPGLARMSLDLLAIPETTVQVERVFSQANLILTFGRSVLDAELAGKIASLGSWFRELGIGK
jgi:hAT family C-terminal dimerisation region